MTAAAFSKLVLRSRAPAEAGLRVVGDLTLGPAAVRGFTCRNCVFEGDVTARGVRFAGPVDLSGSTVAGDLDFSDSTFAQGLYASGATFERIVDLRRGHVTGRVDMADATFMRAALFGSPVGARKSFAGNVDFTLATFAQLVTFEAATFGGTANFALTRFGSDAIFAGTTFDRNVTFRRATFSGAGDYDGSTFNDTSNFTAAEFGGAADFSLSKFFGPATFDNARFAAEASYIGASFFRTAARKQPDSFSDVNAAGGLDFALAEFDRMAVFTYATSAPVTLFTGAQFGQHGLFEVSNASFAGLHLSVDSLVRHVDDAGEGDREHMLDALESSAKSGGDLALANDAHYARQVLRSHSDPWYVRWLDYVFYRVGAGYFVRPFNPLAVMLVLAAVFSTVRAFRVKPAAAADENPAPPKEPAAESRRARVAHHPAIRALRAFPAQMIQTLGAIFSRRTDSSGGAGQGEVIAYRVLFACALIGFANSNPTLRQMLDAVR